MPAVALTAARTAQAIKAGDYPPPPAHVSDACRSLLQSMLTTDPDVGREREGERETGKLSGNLLWTLAERGRER